MDDQKTSRQFMGDNTTRCAERLFAALGKTKFCFKEADFNSDYKGDRVGVYFNGDKVAEVCVSAAYARFTDDYKERVREIPQLQLLLSCLDRNGYENNLPIQTSFGSGWR